MRAAGQQGAGAQGCTHAPLLPQRVHPFLVALAAGDSLHEHDVLLVLGREVLHSLSARSRQRKFFNLQKSVLEVLAGNDVVAEAACTCASSTCSSDSC